MATNNPDLWRGIDYVGTGRVRSPETWDFGDVLAQLPTKERRDVAARLLGVDSDALRQAVRSADAVADAEKKQVKSLERARNRAAYANRKVAKLEKEVAYKDGLIRTLQDKLETAQAVADAMTAEVQHLRQVDGDKQQQETKEIDEWLNI